MTVRELIDLLEQMPDYYPVTHGGSTLTEVREVQTMSRHGQPTGTRTVEVA